MQLLGIFVLVACLVIIVDYGLLAPTTTLTSTQQTQINKWAFTSLILLILANMFVKLAIGLFLLRIFTTSQRRTWFVYGILAFVTATSISAAIAVLAECSPIEKLFSSAVQGSCVSDLSRDAIPYYQSSRFFEALSRL